MFQRININHSNHIDNDISLKNQLFYTVMLGTQFKLKIIRNDFGNRLKQQHDLVIKTMHEQGCAVHHCSSVKQISTIYICQIRWYLF